jgi:hypothetical protein
MIPLRKPWGNTKPPVGYGLNYADPINRGLVGKWLMNEGASTPLRNIAGSNTATNISGTKTTTIGNFGNAIQSTTGGYQLPNINDFNPTNEITLCAWYYRVSAISANFASIFDNNVNAAWALWDGRGGSTFAFTVFAGGARTDVNSAVATGQWMFMCGTYKSGSQLLYQNGKVIASAATTGTLGTNTLLQFGSHLEGTLVGDCIDYKMDVAGFYNRALTPGEVQRLYAEPFAGIQTRRAYIPLAQAAAGTFQPAWAMQSNAFLGGGMYA